MQPTLFKTYKEAYEFSEAWTADEGGMYATITPTLSGYFFVQFWEADGYCVGTL